MPFEKPQQVHRSGLLKQQNKGHKHGRHRSKNELDKVTKGRVEVKLATKRARKEKSRLSRKHQATQIRKNKRDEIVAKKRALGSQESPPFLVAVVPLGSAANPLKLLKLIKNCDQDAVIKSSPKGVLHVSLPRFRQRFSLIVPPPGDIYATLDVTKVADTVVFLIAPDPDGVQSIAEGSLAPTASSLREGILGFDAEGGVLLSTIMAQGLPSPIFALMDLDRVPQKRRGDMKKTLHKQVEKVYPLDKLEVLDNEADALRLLHQIGSQKQRPVFQRDQRPHLLAEKYTFSPDEDEKSRGTLAVEGYIRGQPLSVNSLVHIPGWGDFQLSAIQGPHDPYLLITSQRKRKDEAEELAETIYDIADLEKQESLQAENELDPMEGEQTWPSAEEMKEEAIQDDSGKTKRVPKGTSEYQAAWIKDVLEAGGESDSDSGSDSEDNDMALEDGDSDDEDIVSVDEDENSAEEDMESIAVTESGEPERYDKKVSFNFDDEEEDLHKIKQAREDAQWPDEIDTPKDVPARTRFQKYRGLQSFRTSAWDPKENLPSDYARIFQFENFNRTRKRVLQTEREGVEPGTYVRLLIKDVPAYLVVGHASDLPLTVVGVLPHEQKMSVVNLLLKRPLATLCGEQLPLQSKDKLILHCGYRRFIAAPIYSQHTSGNKHKYERFFRPESTVVATIYAPIMYPPASVLAFQERHGTQQLVATGSVLQVNPDRIITKRIVLSGHSFKVHKKSAVVRFMFFSREDIDWFKPVELRTKYGRRGHIREPLGTHGHMKCVFDGQIKSQDTVLMNLYKRVFPKWVYETRVPAPPPLYQCESNLADDDIMA